MGIEIFKKHLREKRAIKISTGFDNYNIDSVAKICRAAQISKASAIEIVSNKNVYEIARRNTKLPLFVSSIHPFEILEAVKFGVDGIQIGNYYSQYKQGKIYTADQIYNIVLEALALINDYDVYTCVTIPASLSFPEQCELVKKLAILGVDLIQTEGYKKSITNSNVMVESAEISIKNMEEISKHTIYPVMVSGITNCMTLKTAFDNGASAVSVELPNNKIISEAGITAFIMEMVGSISNRNSLYKEIVKSSRELIINNIY